MNDQERNYPQLSCTITQEDQKCLDEMCVDIANYINRVIKKSELIRALIRIADHHRGELFDMFRDDKRIEEFIPYGVCVVLDPDYSREKSEIICQAIQLFDGVQSSTLMSAQTRDMINQCKLTMIETLIRSMKHDDTKLFPIKKSHKLCDK